MSRSPSISASVFGKYKPITISNTSKKVNNTKQFGFWKYTNVKTKYKLLPSPSSLKSVKQSPHVWKPSKNLCGKCHSVPCYFLIHFGHRRPIFLFLLLQLPHKDFLRNWDIVALQRRVSFCRRRMWIACMYTHIPSLRALPPTPLGHHRAWRSVLSGIQQVPTSCLFYTL